MDQATALSVLLTTGGTLFVVELTDKDALFLLALATKTKPSVTFAAGALAFVATSAIIVAAGSLLIAVVPVFAIKLVGGGIMLAYAGFEYYRFSETEKGIEEREGRVLARRGPSSWSVFVPALVTLIALDLAGDATELVTVVFLARFGDATLVFFGAVIGLVGAVALETALGNTLGRVLSQRKIKYFSIAVFLVVGATIIATTLLSM